MVEKDSNLGNRGFLDDQVNENGLYPIHGIALGPNDITVGSASGEPKLWRPDVLEEAADTLEGKDIVVNHENQDAYMKIGEVEEAKYDEERGVIYKGSIDDEELAEKISRDWLEVSPRIKHTKAHEEIQGVKVPEAIRDFDNLSVVRRGAAGSNELNLGETEELSVEELQASFDEEDDSVSEYQSIADDDTIEELQGDDIDYARWMYEDREGAEGASQRFGCEGAHSHEVDGKTWYMPCETHDRFLKGLGETDGEDMQLSEEDYVTGEFGRGKIIEWTENGVYEDSIDNGEIVESLEDDPVVRVEVYEEVEDGWSSTGKFHGCNFSEIEKLQMDSDELAAHDGDEYTSGEMRMASQMASHSELTKSECLAVVDAFNPTHQTDYSSLAQMIYKVLDEEGMEKFYAELDKRYKDKEYSGADDKLDSPLNSIFA